MNHSGVNQGLAFARHLSVITMFTPAQMNCTEGGNKPEFDLSGLNTSRCENTLRNRFLNTICISNNSLLEALEDHCWWHFRQYQVYNTAASNEVDSLIIEVVECKNKPQDLVIQAYRLVSDLSWKSLVGWRKNMHSPFIGEQLQSRCYTNNPPCDP